MIRFPTPLGYFEIERSEIGISRVRLTDQEVFLSSQDELLTEARHQLEMFFERKLTAFNLAIDLSGGTIFQQEVWRYLSSIPYGETRTYGQIARALNNPGSVRAVGAANGSNPLAIVLPCHRVIASNGRLGGYFYGLKMKRWLLEMEGAPNNIGLFRK